MKKSETGYNLETPDMIERVDDSRRFHLVTRVNVTATINGFDRLCVITGNLTHPEWSVYKKFSWYSFKLIGVWLSCKMFFNSRKTALSIFQLIYLMHMWLALVKSSYARRKAPRMTKLVTEGCKIISIVCSFVCFKTM